jgi:hypothetical protein
LNNTFHFKNDIIIYLNTCVFQKIQRIREYPAWLAGRAHVVKLSGRPFLKSGLSSGVTVTVKTQDQLKNA